MLRKASEEAEPEVINKTAMGIAPINLDTDWVEMTFDFYKGKDSMLDDTKAGDIL